MISSSEFLMLIVIDTPLLNEKFLKICSILGIVYSNNWLPDDNIQLIANFNIGEIQK